MQNVQVSHQSMSHQSMSPGNMSMSVVSMTQQHTTHVVADYTTEQCSHLHMRAFSGQNIKCLINVGMMTCNTLHQFSWSMSAMMTMYAQHNVSPFCLRAFTDLNCPMNQMACASISLAGTPTACVRGPCPYNINFRFFLAQPWLRPR